MTPIPTLTRGGVLRRGLTTSLAGLALAAAGISAHAQTFPGKPLTLVSPFAAGGTSDVVSRAVARQMEADLGQSVVVMNRVGAGGTVGVGSVATGPADGYSLVMGGLGSIVFPTVIYKGKIKYDAAKDLTPLGAVGNAATVIAVRSGLPAKTLAELIALAKAQPGKLSFGSAGVGGTLHLAGVMLQNETGIELNHVPYKGGAPALMDLAAGNVDIALVDLTLVKPMIGSDRIRVIAIASGERSAMLPGVPTTAEVGFPNLKLDTWYAAFAPAATPPQVLARLRASVQKVKTNPELATALASQGIAPFNGGLDAFEKQLKRDYEVWIPMLARVCGQTSCD